MRGSRFLHTAALLASSCALSSCVTQQTSGTAATTVAESDNFRALDVSLREAYLRAWPVVATVVGPFVTVDGRTLTLSRGSQQASNGVFDSSWQRPIGGKLSEQYALLRQVPLQVFQLASASGENRPKAAATYAALVRSALDALDTSVIPPAQLPDQRTVLQLSLDMLDRLAAGTETSPSDADAFVQRVLPAFRRNFNAEVAATIAALATAVEEMRSLLAPGEWERLYVAVEDKTWPQLARVRYDYFAKLLGQNARGKRLFMLPGSGSYGPTTSLRSIMIEDDLARAFFGTAAPLRAP